MDRRTFLKVAGGAAGGAVLGGGLVGAMGGASGALPSDKAPSTSGLVLSDGHRRQERRGRMLAHPATASPIDHVVVVMMENRSFDHWLGWLGDDEAWLEAGRSRHGKGFGITADQTQSYPFEGGQVPTAHLLDLLAGGNPWRGCDHPDPGHSWNAGRAQRDGGFLAPGSRNDQFALGYYEGDDLPFTSRLARRFTVCDRSFASILGPTYPNREYLHSATSGGNKTNYLPIAEGGFTWDTIWDRLDRAGVSRGYYFTDLPVTALWGGRLQSFTAPIDDYFTRCAEGTLPQVTFVDPGFLTGSRTDNHPHGDVRAGEAFQRDVFAAFASSPHWERGLFVLTYDEWGGFFDHIAPPRFHDDRRSSNDDDDFGQAGFRIPTVIASPYAPVGGVDSRVYDHTSVLRFLEWRFLGAPAEGPGGKGASWFLTERDRHALNLGGSLHTDAVVDVDFDLDVAVDPPSPDCPAGDDPSDLTGGRALAEPVGVAYERHSFEDAYDAGYFERVGYRAGPSTMARDWQF